MLTVVCLPYARNNTSSSGTSATLPADFVPAASPTVKLAPALMKKIAAVNRADMALSDSDGEEMSLSDDSDDDVSSTASGPTSSRGSGRKKYGLARKAAANNAAVSRPEAVPADPWLFGKPAQARIPLEVRLPEQLEVRLHKLCAKGGGEFTVKILPPADHSEADDHTAMVLAPQHQVASAQAAQQLTLILTRSSVCVRANGWSGPKRLQAAFSRGVRVEIEHYARDYIALHVPGGADGVAAADDEMEVIAARAARQSITQQPAVEVVRMEVIGGREARDLLVLSLRYFVAQHCLSTGARPATVR